jgi:hypothetical protein
VVELKLALQQTSESRSIDQDSEAGASSAAMLVAWYGDSPPYQIPFWLHGREAEPVPDMHAGQKEYMHQQKQNSGSGSITE